MSNYSNTEKSLKRWLKTRVKVTMATVVGFLIAGTVAFGAVTVEGVGKEETTKTNVTEITDQLFLEDNIGKLVSGQDNKTAIYVTKGSSEDGVVKAKGNLQSKNEKSWLITATDGVKLNIEKDAVLSGKNLSRTTLNLYGTTETTNEGTIEKAENGWAAVTISGAKDNGKETKKTAKFTNKGTVKGDINAEDNVDFTNEGIIDGKIYTDKADGIKNIILSGAGAKTGAIELKGGENTLAIKDGVNDTIDNITGMKSVSVSKSKVTFSEGVTATALVDSSAGKGILTVENSNLDTAMDIIGTGNNVNKSSLITNLVSDETQNGTFNLINRGDLTSEKAQNAIWTKGTSGVTMNVSNKGNIVIGEANDTQWSSGLNASFQKEVKNGTISMTNDGKITITNGAGMDITNSGDETNKGIMTNGKDGAITIKEFGVGMLAEGKGVSAVNNGTIVINEGTKGGKDSNLLSYGMQAKNGAELENNGTIVLEYKDTENVKAMGLDGEASKGVNNGKIKLSDITNTESVTIAEGETAEKTLLEKLFGGDIKHNGMIVNKFGENLFADGNVGNENDLSGSEFEVGEIVSKEGINEKITVGTAGTTIKGAAVNNEIQTKAFNVSGEVKIAGGAGNSVVIKDSTTNLDVHGKFTVEKDTELKFVGGTVNGEEDSDTVDLGNSSTTKLTLDKTVFNGSVVGQGEIHLDNATVNGYIEGSGLAIGGNGRTHLNGEIGVEEMYIGSSVKPIKTSENGITEAYFSADSELTQGGTIYIGKDDKVVLGIGAKHNYDKELKSNVYTQNLFGNTNLGAGETVTIKGDNDTATEDLVLQTGNVSGKEALIDLGANTILGAKDATLTLGTDSDIYTVVDEDKEMAGEHTQGANNLIKVTYNTDLYKENDTLSSIHNAASVLGGVFAKTKDERATQLDKIYADNIYSETVRAAYDGIKLTEDAVLSMNHDVKAGQFKANGKALYSKDEYTRQGTVGSYDTEAETTGLLASFEYGLNDTVTAGMVFSGVKQDVDSDSGNADADLFYLGIFGTKGIGNYDFTAGMGYQFGKYEANNNIANILGSDKYDSSAFNGYIQGKYIADLGDGLSVQPKVKLGYTYIEQDDVKDSYFGLSDAEISTVDTEIGLDVVKSVQFEQSKLDITFGASYLRTMGDTDEEFIGNFYGLTETSDNFNILGAELSENVLKFNIGAELSKENGFFYNGGFTYEFGSNDIDAYGVNVGVGYRF